MDVSKEFYAECDVGNLCVTSAADLSAGKKQGEAWLKSLATKGTQFLVNRLFELPASYSGDVAIAQLPKPTTVLPREKPVPKPKPLTKWQKFAKEKGIKKTKKENLVWDQMSKGWKPRYGYKSKAHDKSDWLIEVPEHADPNVDYFALEKEKKAENVAKNEYQRLRNIAASSKTKDSTLESVDKAGKNELLKSISVAKASTASLGKFTPKLPKEKPPKHSANKRKFEPNIPSSMSAEKEKNLRILEDINKKKPKLDINEAVQVHLQKKQKPKSENPEGSKKSKKNKKKKQNVQQKGKRDKTFSKKKGKKFKAK